MRSDGAEARAVGIPIHSMVGHRMVPPDRRSERRMKPSIDINVEQSCLPLFTSGGKRSRSDDYYTISSHGLSRPLNGSTLVAPSHLSNYRKGHDFLGPSCLCPWLKPIHEEPIFKEVAIHKPVFGCYAGEYVAECVDSRCGYIGESAISLLNTQVLKLPFSLFRSTVCKNKCSCQDISCQRSVLEHVNK